MRNLRIDEKTTFSMRLSWQPADTTNLLHHRLSYSSDGGPEETVGGRGRERAWAWSVVGVALFCSPSPCSLLPQRVLPLGQNGVILQPLLADTEYRIQVTPVYHHGDGPTTTQMERTRETLGVLEVSWVHQAGLG